MPEPDDLDGMTDAELEALTNPASADEPAPPAEEAAEETAEEKVEEKAAPAEEPDAEQRARFEQAIASEEIQPFEVIPPPRTIDEAKDDILADLGYTTPETTGMAPPEEVAEDDGLRICFDRVLPDDLAEKHAQLTVEENPANAPIYGSVLPSTLTLKLGRLWAPGRTLRVKFLDGDPAVVARIKSVLASYLALINLKFEYVMSGAAEIRVAFQPGQGSWSYVGTECLAVPADRPTMNFGWLTPTLDEARFRQVVLHEFGHALGACHEHQNPKVAIPWDREAVYRIMGGPPNNWDRATVDANFFAKYDVAQVDATAFDARSIMCYQFGPPLTQNGFSTPYNTELSHVDRAKLVSAYPRTGPPTDENGEPDPHAPAPAITPIAVGGPPVTAAVTSRSHPATFRLVVPAGGILAISSSIVRGGNESPILELRTAAGSLLTSRIGLIQVPVAAAEYQLVVRPRTDLQQPLTFAVRARMA